MPIRTVSLVTNEVYHIVNRGVDSIPIFKNQYDYQKFIYTFLYYQNNNPPRKFSELKKLPLQKRKSLLENLRKKKDFLVEIIAYCLMPNHYHFVLKQIKKNGIIDFSRSVLLASLPV